MRWVSRDDGAATIVVVVLLSVFLLGLGAVVTDVGSWYAQRAQLQNGADAGALAVAQTCANGTCDTSAATKYAPDNSNGSMGTSSVVSSGFPCGNGGGLPGCPSGTEDGKYCPAPPASGRNYVDVHVENSTKVPPVLGQLLDKNDTGKTILSCAQAVWGAPGALGNVVPFTISACEWLKNTNNGNQFATAPTAANPSYPPSYLMTLAARSNDNDYDITPNNIATNYYRVKNIVDPHAPPANASIAGSETVLLAKSGNNGVGSFGAGCRDGNSASDQTAPGQFGWLCKGNCTSTNPCIFSFSGTTYTGSTGAPPPACEDIFTASRNNQTPIFMPVYTSVVANGSNTTYTLDGFAAFVVTGWGNLNAGQGFRTASIGSIDTQHDATLPNTRANSYYADYCDNYVGTNGNQTQCIYGYFTQALIPASDLPGGSGTPLGATAPYLTG